MANESPTDDEDLIPCQFVLDMEPEEFERLRGRFLVEMGKLCKTPPDDVEITGVRKVREEEL